LSAQDGQMTSSKRSTHFGYRTVDSSEKAGLVRGVFDSVASRYDLMNDLMSFGVHRLWKRFAIELAGVRPGQRVLDLASGTGDLADRFADLVGPDGLVLMTDINAAMLGVGRDRMLDRGHAGNLAYLQVDAESLPLADDSLDLITIAFGLRNVTDKDRALAAMYRALRPGGRALVLEFSKPANRPLERLYDIYSFHILPQMGRLVARDAESYRYLAESIRMHPDQETLRGMMEQAGFEHCDVHNLTGGIVAVHRGFKL
jgi:demethylmenaquinone methyltransferase/2-methoxy-6-polyprenyl-1,4-benzoquinol methylase